MTDTYKFKDKDPMIKMTSCMPLGLTCGNPRFINCLKMYYLCEDENERPFILCTIYVDALNEELQLMKNHDLYTSDKMMRRFLSLFSEAPVYRTDLQFFVMGSPEIIRNNKGREVSIVGVAYDKTESNEENVSKENVCIITLPNNVFVNMSGIHESILNFDFTFEDNDDLVYKKGNYSFTKVFETVDILDIYDYEDYYKILFKVQDNNRSKYTLLIDFDRDDFDKYLAKKIDKFIKKKDVNYVIDNSVYSHNFIITNAYINGINCISLANLLDSIWNKECTHSADIKFVFTLNNERDEKIFYFDDTAIRNLMDSIKRKVDNK